MLAYPIELERDDNDTLLVTFPDFPEAQTFGADRADALKRAEEALATIIDEYVRRWRKIPRPSPGRLRVPVPALTAAKLQLYDTMLDEGIGKAELARRLKWHKPQVDRLFDVFHHSRLDQLEQAFSALGRRLVVSVDVQVEAPAEEIAGRGGKSRTGLVGVKRLGLRRHAPSKASVS